MQENVSKCVFENYFSSIKIMHSKIIVNIVVRKKKIDPGTIPWHLMCTNEIQNVKFCSIITMSGLSHGVL